MPFTFAHPAVVLPIKRHFKFFNLPALIVGSVVPDFGYYFPTPKYFNDLSHTFGGLFFFSLPIGLIIFCFYCLLRIPFTFVLPEPHRLAMKQFSGKIEANPFYILSMLISIIIGAATHILWDSFTHKTGIFVSRFDFLSYPLLETKDSNYLIFNLLQHISTLIGISYLSIKYFRWSKLQSSGRSRLSGRHLIWFTLAIFALASCINIATNIPEEISFWTVRKIGFQLVVQFIQSFVILLFLLLLVIKGFSVVSSDFRTKLYR